MRLLLLLTVAVGLAGCGDVGDFLHPSRTYQSASTGAVCWYRDSVAFQGDKVCNYDCGGSTVATTVSGGDTCPTTATQ